MTYGERSVRTGAALETVAVLGAGGTMGFAMARNIARAGIAVRAWNRSRDKAEPLAADGAYLADTPADAAAGAGIVLTTWRQGRQRHLPDRRAGPGGVTGTEVTIRVTGVSRTQLIHAPTTPAPSTG